MENFFEKQQVNSTVKTLKPSQLTIFELKFNKNGEMKRDWEIIRTILLKLEEAPTANTVLTPEKIPDFPEQEIAYNMRLLYQAGFIEGIFRESKFGNGAIHAAIATHMTNSGHELLDIIRSEPVWIQIKDTFKSKALDMTFDLVLAVGKKIIAALLDI